jgi:general secretion pathway protein H
VSRGFTLIEVAVVLLVLGLATAVVGPGIGRGAEGLRARAEVAGFSAFLRHAREQAIVRRQVLEVRVDPDDRLLTLTAAGTEAVRAARRLAPGLSVHPDPPSAATVRFLPQGVSSGGRFRIEAAGRRSYVITVDPLTGRVTNRRTDA